MKIFQSVQSSRTQSYLVNILKITKKHISDTDNKNQKFLPLLPFIFIHKMEKFEEQDSLVAIIGEPLY